MEKTKSSDCVLGRDICQTVLEADLSGPGEGNLCLGGRLRCVKLKPS